MTLMKPASHREVLPLFVADEIVRGFTTAEVLRLESYLARLLMNARS